jgi:hypothetical protein
MLSSLIWAWIPPGQKEKKSETIYKQVFIQALFIIVQSWKETMGCETGAANSSDALLVGHYATSRNCK